MRRFLSSIIALIYTAVFIISPTLFAQATSPAFELIVPATAGKNEAFDVTVKALKPDGSINTTYEGTIVFFVYPDNSGATIPANIDSSTDSEFKFTLSHQGQHTFSKAFTFPKEGTYEIIVSDYDNPALNAEDEIMKSITITATGGTNSSNAQVTIAEPIDQDTVGTDTVTVAGTTTPTSTVNFYLGAEKKGSTTSDASGQFSGTVSGFIDGSNTIKAEVLDGTGKAVGEKSVTVKYSVDAPTITSLAVLEGTQIFAGSTINLEAEGDPDLKTVTVQLGENIVVLVPDSTRPGIYSGPAKITNFEGEINPVVNVESFQGTKASFTDLININVITSSFENVKVEANPDKRVRFTFSLKDDLEEIKYFKIKYGTQSGQYEKDIITYEKTQIIEDNQYTWYIPGINQGEYFSTIIALDKDKKELSINSGEQTFSLLNSAETCFIDKVSGVTVKKSGSRSIISWDTLEDAASYQIFKRDADGEYAMIDEITDNTYTINIDMSSEEEIFEDFQIRATCKNGDISGEGAYSESVAVQTGPAAIAFMMLLIASGAAFILMKRGYLR